MSLINDKTYELLVQCNQNISFLANNSKDLKNVENYEPIRQSIEALAKSEFPGSEISVHFFGSRKIIAF